MEEVSIIVGGKKITGTPIPIEKIHAANKRIRDYMKPIIRRYRAKAAKSRRELGIN